MSSRFLFFNCKEIVRKANQAFVFLSQMTELWSTSDTERWCPFIKRRTAAMSPFCLAHGPQFHHLWQEDIIQLLCSQVIYTLFLNNCHFKSLPSFWSLSLFFAHIFPTSVQFLNLENPRFSLSFPLFPWTDFNSFILTSIFVHKIFSDIHAICVKL